MIKEKWYVFALISIIVALFCMVMFNYTALSSNITQSIEDVGSSNLAQAKEELQAYLENGKSVVQTTAVSVEYMVDAGAKAEDIKPTSAIISQTMPVSSRTLTAKFCWQRQ